MNEQRKWQLVYYEMAGGNFPVKDFIDRMDDPDQGKS
jgi:hypothetical protein